MAETVHIPQSDLDDEQTRPAWIPLVTGEPLQPCKPAIRCLCGVVTNIALHHVHPDGRVTASFVHDRPAGDGCGWHVFLFLDGYAAAVGLDFPPER